MFRAWILLPLAACGPDLLEIESGGLRHLSGTVRASTAGTARARLRVEPGDTALLITGEISRPWGVHVRSLRDPAGIEMFNAFQFNATSRNKTNGGFVAPVVTLNWPVLAVDPGLRPGRWEVELGVVDQNLQFTQQDVALDVLFKQDPDFSSGGLEVVVVYTGGLQEDTELRAAVEDAKALWSELYASVGIEVLFQDDRGFAVDEIGPPAFSEEESYREISSQTGVPRVNLVISPEIAGEGFEQVFGIAGDIPGPLVSTPRSGVQVSATLAAGPDGRFSGEDIRLLAETMAHETLHFLGLFHPVEVSYDVWDVLEDTPECASEGRCIDQLGDNLMFPYPVCSVASCRPQDEITPQQGAVANRYTGVD